MAEVSGQGAAPARRGLGLRSHLYMLVAAALVPMLGSGLLAMWRGGERLREDSGGRLLETAALLGHAVDRSIDEHITSLRLLQDADPAAATALWRRHKDPDPDTLVVSSAQGADQLPPGLLQAAAVSASPQVSSLFFRPDAADTPLVAIAVPGQAADGSGAALVMRSNHLIDAVATAAASQRLLVAVVDNTGRIAARSRNPERFLGKPVPDWDLVKGRIASNGVFEATTTEGEGIVFAYQRLESAPGWVLVVGEPLEMFQARWRGPLVGIGLGGLLAAVLALLASQVLATRILRPLRRLAGHARQVSDGRDDAGPLSALDTETSITEFATLQAGLSAAEEALRRQADDARALAARLDRGQRIYRTVAGVGALVFWQARPDGSASSATGWPELTGQPEARALGRGWLDAVHPGDMPELDQAWSRALHQGDPFDVEFRIRDSQAQWRWVRARGDRIPGEDGGWAGVLEDVDARRQAQARVAYLAQHDPLTGLANRSMLMERVARAVQAGREGPLSALLVLDLDRFKEVNDTLGHPCGDALLRTVASRLRGAVRESDLVARPGGDEFAVLLEGLSAPEDAAELARRLVESVQAPYDLDGQRALVGTSIGIALTGPDLESAERLMQNADLALYQVKQQGRGHYRFFEPGMDRRMQARRTLELELREAIGQGQFELHYQPRVGRRDRRLRGFEALLRWRHPVRGLVPPGQFLPMLEETGLIGQVERWAVAEASRQARQWPAPLTLSINLAGSQLTRELPDWLLATLERNGFPPARLELEVSEPALLAGFADAAPGLLRLRAAGVSIVIDQFGGGNSSLGCLRSFPFDKVKIDRSFVGDVGQDMRGAAVISAITHLCAQLGIATVIGGVEREEQLALLDQDAGDEAQGYLFGTPLDATATLELAGTAARPAVAG